MSRAEDSATVGIPQDLVELGRISDAYGLRGWVKIQPHATGSSTLLKVREWWLRGPVAPAQSNATAPARLYRVLKSRTQGSTIVGSLQGVEDRDQAQALRGSTVWVSRAAFPSTQEDEYYWVDLLGCVVYGEESGESVLLGVVDSVMDNGVHAILRVKRQVIDDAGSTVPLLDAKGRAVETLIPFVAAHVHTVDLASRRLDTDWPAEF